MLEVFNSLFMSIAEQMGAALQNTASSVNIKERLDFSCAVFDARGNLVANAPANMLGGLNFLGFLGDELFINPDNNRQFNPGAADMQVVNHTKTAIAMAPHSALTRDESTASPSSRTTMVVKAVV